MQMLPKLADRGALCALLSVGDARQTYRYFQELSLNFSLTRNQSDIRQPSIKIEKQDFVRKVLFSRISILVFYSYSCLKQKTENDPSFKNSESKTMIDFNMYNLLFQICCAALSLSIFFLPIQLSISSSKSQLAPCESFLGPVCANQWP